MREASINGHSLMLPDWRADFYDVREKQGWERERIVSCADLMKPGMRVFDLGAEHGDFTALYKKWVGFEGEVVPVEPSDHYWPIIREIWEANHGVGLAPRWCFVGFISDETDDTLGQPEIGWPKESWATEGIPDGGFRHLAQQRQDNAQITIDDLAAKTGAPDAIVMDIEGAEWHALDGARKTLQDYHPLCWISIHPPTLMEWYGMTPDDIHNLFKDCGYDHAEYLGEEIEEFWLYR